MLSRLIYTSSRRCVDDQIQSLLDSARDFNARNDLTGALYVVGDTFMQYLEGEELVLDALYDRIRRDSRHAQCRLLDRRLIILRIFRGWSMARLVRTPETDQLVEILLPRFLPSDQVKGASAASLFQALARAAERR